MLTLKTIDAHAAGEPLRLIVDGFPVAARQDDARQARMGADARGSPAPRADARAARPRRHVRRDPHRAGDARLARRRPLHAQRRLQHDVRPRHHRGDDDGARARAADARAATATTVVYDAPAGTIRARAKVRARRGRRGRRAARVESVAFLNVPSFVLHGGLDREACLAARFAPTSPSAAPSTRSSTAKRPGCRSTPRTCPSCAAPAWRSSTRSKRRMTIVHPLDPGPDRHLRHDLHRSAERRAPPICATSRSSPTPKSIDRRAAPARPR